MKKVLSMILTLALLIGALNPMGVKAAEVTKPTAEWAAENGWTKKNSYTYTKTIDSINYKLISGQNAYEELAGIKSNWKIAVTNSPDASGVVTIPSMIDGYPVKIVGADAFRSNTKITECVISEGVELIGDGAFQYSYSLTSISLPSTLKMIDAGAFYQCKLLTELSIPASVEYVGRNAFYRNNVVVAGLETLTFEGNAPEILYTSELNGYVLDNVDDVVINVYEGTTGWDSEVWTVLNLNTIKKEEVTPEITETPDVTEIPDPTEIPNVTDVPVPSETETPEPSVTDTPNPSVTESPEITETPGVTNTPEDTGSKEVVGIELDKESVDLVVGEKATVTVSTSRPMT